MAEFTNPSQSGGGSGQDSRSLIVMMVIMVGVFFGLQYYRQKTAPPTPQQTSQSAPATQLPNQPAATSQAAPDAAPTSAMMAMTPAVQATAESTTVVENELYRITFSNRGGAVTSWILKKQQDSNGKPLDLVHQQAAQTFGHPLSLYTYDSAITKAVNRIMATEMPSTPI